MNSLVGPSPGLNSTFNPFHRVSSVASGFYTNAESTPVGPPLGDHILDVASTDGNFLLINDVVTNTAAYGNDYWKCSLGFFQPTADDYQVSNKRDGTGYTTSPRKLEKVWTPSLGTSFELSNPTWSEIAGYTTSAFNFGYRFRSIFNHRYLGLIESKTVDDYPKFPCLLFVDQVGTVNLGQVYPFQDFVGRYKLWVYRLPLVGSTEINSFWINSERNPSLSPSTATSVKFLQDCSSTDLRALTLLNDIVDNLGGFCLVVAVRR